MLQVGDSLPDFWALPFYSSADGKCRNFTTEKLPKIFSSELPENYLLVCLSVPNKNKENYNQLVEIAPLLASKYKVIVLTNIKYGPGSFELLLKDFQPSFDWITAFTPEIEKFGEDNLSFTKGLKDAVFVMEKGKIARAFQLPEFGYEEGYFGEKQLGLDFSKVVTALGLERREEKSSVEVIEPPSLPELE